jgi:hypothetical protein
MKKALESTFPVEVISNSKMPRLSAFEVFTEDGVELWSKLSKPSGRNNYPEVFPTAAHLISMYNKYLGTSQQATTIDRASIYSLGTRVGVW